MLQQMIGFTLIGTLQLQVQTVPARQASSSQLPSGMDGDHDRCWQREPEATLSDDRRIEEELGHGVTQTT
jgi:hypothetical protein